MCVCGEILGCQTLPVLCLTQWQRGEPRLHRTWRGRFSAYLARNSPRNILSSGSLLMALAYSVAWGGKKTFYKGKSWRVGLDFWRINQEFDFNFGDPLRSRFISDANEKQHTWRGSWFYELLSCVWGFLATRAMRESFCGGRNATKNVVFQAPASAHRNPGTMTTSRYVDILSVILEHEFRSAWESDACASHTPFANTFITLAMSGETLIIQMFLTAIWHALENTLLTLGSGTGS